MSNKNIVELEAYTNPAPVLQTDQPPTTCETSITIASAAYGQNSNINGDNVPTVIATTDIIADSAGASATTTSNLNLISEHTDAEASAVNTSNTSVEARITNGSSGNANLNLVATSLGADQDNAQFTLACEGQNAPTATGTINVNAADLGVGNLNINVTGLNSTMNILLNGTTNELNITVTKGIINEISDVLSVENLSTSVATTTMNVAAAGTVTVTAGGTVTVTAPQVNVFSEAVILGLGIAKRLLNDLAAQIFNIHTHMDAGTGVPYQQITPIEECQNVFGS
jgi:hypothetical protein